LRALRPVQPQRVAERADALLGIPEILLKRLKRGGVIRREGLVALVYVARGRRKARLDAGGLRLRCVVGAAEQITEERRCNLL
jgi:hypothetical protein